MCSVTRSFDTLFWSMFGMGDPKAYAMDERHLAMGQVTSHTAHSNILPLAGYVLYSAYMAMMVIVSMNMLIAMMSNSFQEIHVSAFISTASYSMHIVCFSSHISLNAYSMF
jgi:hypothetical protein